MKLKGQVKHYLFYLLDVKLSNRFNRILRTIDQQGDIIDKLDTNTYCKKLFTNHYPIDFGDLDKSFSLGNAHASMALCSLNHDYVVHQALVFVMKPLDDIIFPIHKNLTFNKREEWYCCSFLLGVLFFAVFIYLCKFSNKKWTGRG